MDTSETDVQFRVVTFGGYCYRFRVWRMLLPHEGYVYRAAVDTCLSYATVYSNHSFEDAIQQYTSLWLPAAVSTGNDLEHLPWIDTKKVSYSVQYDHSDARWTAVAKGEVNGLPVQSTVRDSHMELAVSHATQDLREKEAVRRNERLRNADELLKGGQVTVVYNHPHWRAEIKQDPAKFALDDTVEGALAKLRRILGEPKQ